MHADFRFRNRFIHMLQSRDTVSVEIVLSRFEVRFGAAKAFQGCPDFRMGFKSRRGW